MVSRNRSSRSERRAGRTKNLRVQRVDLSEVETYTPMPEGEHHLRVKEIEGAEGDAGVYWKWTFEAADKDGPEGTVTHNTSFAKQALFNLKSLLESLGVDIPDSEEDLNADDYIGLEMMAEVAHEDVETDNGTRRYGRIVDHSPVDKKVGKKSSKRDRDEEPEDEEPQGKARRSSKRNKKADLTEDDVSDMSQDELEDLIKEHDLDIDLGDFKTVSKMRAGVIDALKDAGVIEGGEEEAEEEEERPSRRASSRSRSSKKDEPEEEEEEAEEDDRPSRRSSSRRSRR